MNPACTGVLGCDLAIHVLREGMNKIIGLGRHKERNQEDRAGSNQTRDPRRVVTLRIVILSEVSPLAKRAEMRGRRPPKHIMENAAAGHSGMRNFDHLSVQGELPDEAREN